MPLTAGFLSASTFAKRETPPQIESVLAVKPQDGPVPELPPAHSESPFSRGGAGLHDRGEPGCREEDRTGLREGAGAPGGQRPGQKGNGGAQGRKEGAPR